MRYYPKKIHGDYVIIARNPHNSQAQRRLNEVKAVGCSVWLGKNKEVEVKEINVFGCDYCAMVSRRKGSVARHEANYCRKNPNRITCGNCKHMLFEEGSCEEGENGQSFHISAEWYCEAKEIELESHNMNANIDCKEHQIDA
jgi:hypothetical protein